MAYVHNLIVFANWKYKHIWLGLGEYKSANNIEYWNACKYKHTRRHDY